MQIYIHKFVMKLMHHTSERVKNKFFVTRLSAFVEYIEQAASPMSLSRPVFFQSVSASAILSHDQHCSNYKQSYLVSALTCTQSRCPCMQFLYASTQPCTNDCVCVCVCVHDFQISIPMQSPGSSYLSPFSCLARHALQNSHRSLSESLSVLFQALCENTFVFRRCMKR